MKVASRVRRLLLSLSMLALAWTGLVQACLAQTPPPSADAAAARESKLLQAARREGSLTLYTSLEDKNLKALIEPFENKYGIKVEVWRSGTTRVLQRALAEAAAGRHVVDAIHFGTPELEALRRENLLLPVQSPVLAQLAEGAVPDHHAWAATIRQVFVQSYNTNLVRKEDLPKRYEDLLDPKWKGKLAIDDKAWVWYATVVRSLGEERGERLFRDIVARNGVSVRYGVALLDSLVAAGEVPMALTVYSHYPKAAKAKGAPVDWLALEPIVVRANGIGIARQSPHPSAALLFYDYMLAADGAQKAFAAMNYVPTNTRLPSALPAGRVVQVDPALVLDEEAKWTRAFDDVFRQRGQAAP